MNLEKARARTYEERVEATKEAIAKLVGADKVLDKKENESSEDKKKEKPDA